jgi:hypothetical protein
MKMVKHAQRSSNIEKTTQEDMDEAVCLVMKEKYSIMAATILINDRKKKEIPSIILSIHLKWSLTKFPKWGDLRSSVRRW